MAQKKLLRFKEIKTFPNVLEYPESMQGRWATFFKNNHPVILELACGRGEYTIGLAQLYPDKNFIGVDIKGNRMWVGAKAALNQKLTNVALLRTQIDKINQYFNKDEVEEIWITFPDPHLRKSKARKRLTHPKFLRLYKQFLKTNGLIHLKTDSPDLYQFTKTVIELYGLKIISDINDIYKNENIDEELKFKTHYESLDIAQSNTVFYLCFTLSEILPDNDDKLIAILNAELNMNELVEGEDYYIDKNGLLVFTEKYLLQRETCCGNGCRHCPFDYKNVAEPQRSKLLSLKQDEKSKN